jgi:hypothetical protein
MFRLATSMRTIIAVRSLVFLPDRGTNETSAPVCANKPHTSNSLMARIAEVSPEMLAPVAAKRAR